MLEMLQGLEPLHRIFWWIAIPVTIIFLVQTVMTFIGADASDGLSADFDGDLGANGGAFQLFSFRNMINFLLGFSWSGISFYALVTNQVVLVSLSAVMGCLFVLLFFFIIRQLQKLAEDNSFKIESTVNRTAEVYLTIPPHKSGKGKVQISVNGAFHELEAMTEHERIPSNTMVRIVRIESGNILIVESI